VKVLLTADAVGGVWTYATDLADGLARRGVQVSLAVLGPAPAGALSSRPGVDVVAAPEVQLDWLADSPDAVLASGEKLAGLADEVGADLVHLNSPALAAGGAFRRPVLGVCHSDVATWWAAVRGGRPPADLAWRAELTGRGYAACDALLAPTRAFAEATARAYRVRPRVVHNGRPFPLDGGRWPREAGSDGGDLSARDALAGVGSTPIRPSGPPSPIKGEGVLMCGRLWDEGKGAAVLDRASGSLPAPVLAAGPLQGPGTGEAAFSHLQALGSLSADAVRARMAEAAVFCSPAFYEPFGLAVLEAAQAGVPLVLCDIASFRELWDGAALFTPPGDAEALAAALDALLADERERARLSDAARRRAARYSLDAMVDGTLAAYRELVPVRAAA
jgi:hypothetical protein